MSRILKLSRSNVDEALEADPSIERILSQLRRVDKDGNGELSLSEVASCVKDLADSEKERGMLRKLVLAMFILMLLFAAAIVGMTYAIVDLSKDTKITGGVLQAKDGDANSAISTAAVHGLRGDGAATLLYLTPGNVSTLHSMMIPCASCSVDGSLDVYNVAHVRLISHRKLVAVYTDIGEVIVADADVPGLQVFGNTTEAAAYLEEAVAENADIAASGGTRRRRLFQTKEVVKGGVVINSASLSAPGRTGESKVAPKASPVVPVRKKLQPTVANNPPSATPPDVPGRSKDTPLVATTPQQPANGKKLLATPTCPDLFPVCYGKYPCESKCSMTDCKYVCFCDLMCKSVGDCCSDCSNGFPILGTQYYTVACSPQRLYKQEQYCPDLYPPCYGKYPCESKCTRIDCKYTCFCDEICKSNGDCCNDCPSFNLGGFYTPTCSPTGPMYKDPIYIAPPPPSCPELDPKCYGSYPCESKCTMADCATDCYCDQECLMAGDCCSDCPNFFGYGFCTLECSESCRNNENGNTVIVPSPPPVRPPPPPSPSPPPPPPPVIPPTVGASDSLGSPFGPTNSKLYGVVTGANTVGAFKWTSSQRQDTVNVVMSISSTLANLCSSTLRPKLTDTRFPKHVWKIDRGAGASKVGAATCADVSTTTKSVGFLFACTLNTATNTVSSCTCTANTANCANAKGVSLSVTYSSSKAYYFVLTSASTNTTSTPVSMEYYLKVT